LDIIIGWKFSLIYIESTIVKFELTKNLILTKEHTENIKELNSTKIVYSLDIKYLNDYFYAKSYIDT
jgi:hypothetical protein